MMTIRDYLERATLRRSTGVYAAILLVALFALAACGSDDTAAAQACTFSSDCDLGYSCSFENECIQVSCDNCAGSSDLVCLVTPEHPEGVCSRPECTSDDQCDVANNETCNDGLCAIGSTGCDNNDANCPEGQVCNFADECVPDDTQIEDCGGCATGETCNTTTGVCEGGSTDACEGVTCDVGQVCNPANGQCEDDQTTDACNNACSDEQTCNETTGQCEGGTVDPCNGTCTANQICDGGTCVENSCPPGSQTPESCAQDPVYNLFDAENCYCAECLVESDCNTAAGETCTETGECMACTESCDIADGESACSQDGFFCINECCIECTGNSDCDVAGEVCVDGTCAPPPSCENDPTVCRAGTVCENGVCQAPNTGAGCTSAMDCFPGTCNMQTNTCEGGAGSGLPGGCSSDADCANGEVCGGGLICAQSCIPLLGQCPGDGFCMPTSFSLPPEGFCL